jgi:hypothetical protein
MTTEVNHHIGLEGIFNFKLTNTKTGEVREYEFKNLILNSGIDYYMTSYDSLISGCILGSSSVPPVATDISITNILGTSTTHQTGGAGASNITVLPYYTSYYWTYRFIEGVATGNIAQVAITYGSVSTANNTYTGLFSKALVKDGNGTPITITKLADEVLDVTYTLRIYTPSADVIGTTTISGVNYDYIVRAASAGSWTLSSKAVSSVYTAKAYTGTIGTELGTPSGSSGEAATRTFDTYVVGTHTRTATIFWDLNQGNLSGGIRSVYLGFGNYYGAGIYFQIQYTANPAHPDTTVTIPKDATKRLTLKYQFTVGRV